MSQFRVASKDAAVLSNKSIQTPMIDNPFRLPWIGRKVRAKLSFRFVKLCPVAHESTILGVKGEILSIFSLRGHNLGASYTSLESPPPITRPPALDWSFDGGNNGDDSGNDRHSGGHPSGRGGRTRCGTQRVIDTE